MPTGQFTAEPITLTINGETKTWGGRGRKPKWLAEYEAANGPARESKKAREAAKKKDAATNV